MYLRNFGLGLLLAGALVSVSFGSTRTELAGATSQGKVAFILVTDPGVVGIPQAKDLIQTTMKQVKNATMVELVRSDPANADLVAEYRLAGAPVPLILVAARNGVLAGGLIAAQASTEKLLAIVPSPKKADVLKALQSGKAVFITASRKGMASQSGAMASCAAACGQMKNQGVAIAIDLDDPQEAEFLGQLKASRTATEPMTFVINAQGQLTQTYTGATEVASLVQAATKSAGGCAPGACGPGAASSCGPKK
ncbi:MAG: hypothetical protein IPO18_11445 [bacterium]|nr:hypothetical protein [bacterium]